MRAEGSEVESSNQLQITASSIPGLLVIDLPVHADSRGWFKENWQREKMVALGLPDFEPIQNNISFNHQVGVTRGIHAEPWDKFVSVAAGKVFGAWVDLRSGDSFGTVFTTEITPGRAVFVPRGVGNAYQTLEPATSYTYLVNAHWSADAQYTFLNLADKTVAISWPIPLDQAIVSDKDRAHPMLVEVVPVQPKKILVIGANGQLGRALQTEFADSPNLVFLTSGDLNLADADLESRKDWREFEVVVNAAAYTSVDAAETADGRIQSWLLNAQAPAQLARLSIEYGFTLIHISSDYVFDGQKTAGYSETDSLAPLGVYGQSKAAGDIAVAQAKRHYILRTSWVVGDGKNFVRTMQSFAKQGKPVEVVNNQFGRLTFASELASGIAHVIRSRPTYGTYHLTNSGDSVSWFDIAREVYAISGADTDLVSAVSAEEYAAKASGPVAPRPTHSTLELEKITSTGFHPSDWRTALRSYLSSK